ncbi:ATP-binding protein [Marinicellulosiphila megalodicopiae]|uniref:ATP-binding protein n=1 Tax=Marinicellulosiphila megalodicopiae TaxID=2724896 RepID=UPI003BAF7A89
MANLFGLTLSMFSMTSIKARIFIIISFFALISIVNAYIHLSSVSHSQTRLEANKQHQLDAYAVAHEIQNELQILSSFKQPILVDLSLLPQSISKLQQKVLDLKVYFEHSVHAHVIDTFYDQSIAFSNAYKPYLDEVATLNTNNKDSLFIQIKKQGFDLGYLAHDFQSLELMYILTCINDELINTQRSGRFMPDHQSLPEMTERLTSLINSNTHYSKDLDIKVKKLNTDLNKNIDQYLKTKNGLKGLIENVQAFHTFLESHHVQSLVEDIYLLRVYENELLNEHHLLYFEESQVTQFTKNYNEIFLHIEQSKLNDSNKELLVNTLNKYISTLDQITEFAAKAEAKKTELTQLHRILYDTNTKVFQLLPDVFTLQNTAITKSIERESIMIACIYLLIALCIFVVFWMAINNRMLIPLKQLQRAAKEYGEGKQDITVSIRSKDELGQLAQTFTAMMFQLNNKNSKLVDSLESITIQDDNKRNFVAMISHEIRTPLNGIIGMSYLAQQSNTDLKVQSYLDSIFRSSNSLLGIINDLMDFSKIESSKFDISPIKSDLGQLLDNVGSTVGLYAEEKKLPFLFEIGENVPRTLIMDSQRLQQVLINLSNNSIKFTQSGQVVIRITELKKSKKDKHKVNLRFSVIDTGPGLTKKQIDSIFTPFKQADNSITRRFGGTGLGLSISQEIIHLMDSKIQIDSLEGKGSEFFFDVALPAIDNIPSTQSGTYFLLTNDSILFKNIETNLCKQDLLIHSNNINQAREYLSDTHFDYIIFDWQCFSESLEDRKLIVDALQKTSATIMGLSYIKQFTSLKNFTHPLFEKYPNRLIINNKPFLRFNLTDPTWSDQTIQSDEFYNQSLYIKGKVLVVEDDLINQQVVTELLKSFGLDVFVADNGREAITMANNIYPDVILMDIEMQGMDGYQTCHELRQDTQFTNTPIIALTGLDIRNTAKYQQVKFTDTLVKPLDPTALHRLLQSYLMQQLNEQKLVKLSKMDDLALLTTFDYTSGLKRVAGEKQLYIDLIKEFHSHYSDAKLVLDMLIQAKDYEPACKYCHRLKGVAGNLGNSKLQEALNKLEEELRKHSPKPESLSGFEQCFTESISEINLFMQTLPKKHESYSSNVFASQDEIFNGLHRYIDNADGEIIDYFNEYKNTFKQMLEKHDFDQLDDAINHFNFARAATILNKEAE